MSELRVLVVDDSVAVRRALSDAISAEPGLVLCGAAPNGLLALQLLPRARPDVIVLDLEMPELDGLEFLSRMRPAHPRLPVLVFSGTVGHANEATLEAMWRGASDYLLKPRGLDAGTMLAFLRAELIPRLRALAGAPGRVWAAPAATPAAPPVPGPRPRTIPAAAPGIVVVGASTGGPRALSTMLAKLPRDFAPPVIVVQHLPAEMCEFFTAGLASDCDLPVRVAEDDAPVASGAIWVAPGGAHLLVAGERARARFRYDHGPEQNGCRPSVDPLFRSAAALFGSSVLAVVLTGMGHDGLEGARAVHAAGGQVLVQDEGSSVVWGMPGAVARAGLADAVLPLGQIGRELAARASSRHAGERGEAA